MAAASAAATLVAGGASASAVSAAASEPVEGKHGITVQHGPYVFSSQFDSGNLGKVERVKDDEYILFPAPDCAGLPCQTKNRTWFYFSLTGGSKDTTLKLTVRNMNPQPRLYGNDYRPFVKVLPTQPAWDRLKTAATMRNASEFSISFKYRFEADGETVYFAFCYPWSYTECLEWQREIERLATTRPDLYVTRELLVRSPQGRRVDLLTITAPDGADATGAREPGLPAPLLPLARTQPRPLSFPNKRFFFVSARVHPGETPGQFMLDGLVEFLLRRDDPRAQRLRELYVFKIVPMLNPDGVALGHYRADIHGVNLNRVYTNPDPVLHPSVFGARAVIQQLAATGRLQYYVDLHAHATKRGVFFFGNAIPDFEKQVDNLLFARLVALNCPHVDFAANNFTEKNMVARDPGDRLSKEGSGRVATYLSTGITHCYTIEAHYNKGRWTQAVPAAAGADGRASPPVPRGIARPYTQAAFRHVGRAVAVAVLDMQEGNPWSRVPASEFGSLLALRRQVAAIVRAERSGETMQTAVSSPVLVHMTGAAAAAAAAADGSDEEEPSSTAPSSPMRRLSVAMRSSVGDVSALSPPPPPPPSLAVAAATPASVGAASAVAAAGAGAAAAPPPRPNGFSLVFGGGAGGGARPRPRPAGVASAPLPIAAVRPMSVGSGGISGVSGGVSGISGVAIGVPRDGRAMKTRT